MFGFEGENAREKVIVLLTMCFALAMAMLDNTVVNVALPSIQNHLGAGFSELRQRERTWRSVSASSRRTGGATKSPITRLRPCEATKRRFDVPGLSSRIIRTQKA